MRRIYDSEALRRDDEEPHSPRERRRRGAVPQSITSLNASALSDWLLPHRLRHRAIAVEISTPREEYAVGEAVPFAVTMRNRLPVPVTIETASPLLWTWHVDGDEEASQVPQHDPPSTPGEFAFDRGERKEFRRRWSGLFRISETEWEPASPGEYVVGAAINVTNAAACGLAAETTVRVVPE